MSLMQKYLRILPAFACGVGGGEAFLFPSTRWLAVVWPLLWFVFLDRCARGGRDALAGSFLSMVPVGIAGAWMLLPDAESWQHIIRFVSLAGWAQSIVKGAIVATFAVWVSLPRAFAGWLYFRLKRGVFFDSVLGASLWTLGEFVRSKMTMDVVWVGVGYWLFAALPVTGLLARVGGVHSITFLGVFIAGVCVYLAQQLRQRRSFKYGIVFAAILFFGFASSFYYGSAVVAKERLRWQQASLPVAAVQGYIPWTGVAETEAFQGFLLSKNYHKLLSEMQRVPGGIVVLPEEAFPGINPEKEAYPWRLEKEAIQTFQKQKGASAVLVGQLVYHRGNNYNSILIFNAPGGNTAQTASTGKLLSNKRAEPPVVPGEGLFENVGIYIKSRLFPLIEYLPPEGEFAKRFIPLLGSISAPSSEIVGLGTSRIASSGGIESRVGALGVFGCLELLVPEFVSGKVARGADVLISSGSEIAWDRHVWEQDLLVARLHALATKRFLVRAMKQGYSVVVNPLGEAVARSAGDNDEIVYGKVALVSDQTPYVRYGDWIVWVAALIVAGAVIANMATKWFCLTPYREYAGR